MSQKRISREGIDKVKMCEKIPEHKTQKKSLKVNIHSFRT